MYSKFIKLIVIRSILVCCGFAGRVLNGRFPQLCRTRERSTSHAYSLWITLGRRHRKQRTDRVVEDKGEQLESNINSSTANGTEISANPVVHEAIL